MLASLALLPMIVLIIMYAMPMERILSLTMEDLHAPLIAINSIKPQIQVRVREHLELHAPAQLAH
jgi:hypothetical protein